MRIRREKKNLIKMYVLCDLYITEPKDLEDLHFAAYISCCPLFLFAIPPHFSQLFPSFVSASKDDLYQ